MGCLVKVQPEQYSRNYLAVRPEELCRETSQSAHPEPPHSKGQNPKGNPRQKQNKEQAKNHAKLTKWCDIKQGLHNKP